MRWTLTPNVVHVWRASLLVRMDVRAHLEATLSAGERQRAHRLRLRAHRERFIVSRGIQRDILARYLDVSPASLQFRHDVNGKPELPRPFDASGFRFNVASAGDVALIAVAFQREVGVDVEQIRWLADVARVAERFFSPGEQERLNKLLPVCGIRAFFECWTRKEAWIKAAGQGMSLDQFDVAFGPRKRARLLRVQGRRDEARRWTMKALDVGDDYVAALCTTAGDVRIDCCDWPSGRGIRQVTGG